MAKTYKAVVVRELGGPEVLKIEELPLPEPSAGQVVVQIKAAGVNPVETYRRTGGPYAPALPWFPGTDGAGIVTAVGADVTNVKVGERVWLGGSLTGTYAEYALVNASDALPLPDNVTFEQGAAVNIPYRTAFRALFQRGGAKAGQTVLVHGGSGGTGLAVVQTAAAHGLKVFATAGTEAGLTLVTREGATRAFNHRSTNYRDEILAATGGRGVDLIIELSAHDNLPTDFNLVKQGGTIVIVGGREPVSLHPGQFIAKEVTVTGVLVFFLEGEYKSQVDSFIGAGLNSGVLRPQVGKSFSLSEAGKAHEEVIAQTGGANGKIVLLP